jgi:hypothetical protein
LNSIHKGHDLTGSRLNARRYLPRLLRRSLRAGFVARENALNVKQGIFLRTQLLMISFVWKWPQAVYASPITGQPVCRHIFEAFLSDWTNVIEPGVRDFADHVQKADTDVLYLFARKNPSVCAWLWEKQHERRAGTRVNQGKMKCSWMDGSQKGRWLFSLTILSMQTPICWSVF